MIIYLYPIKNAFSQKDTCWFYTIDTTSFYKYYKICICENGYYYITLNGETYDETVINYKTMLSFGKYKRVNKYYEFSDFKSNFKIIIKKNNDELEIIKGFHSLIGKDYKMKILESIGCSDIVPSRKAMSKEKLIQKLIMKKKSYATTLKTGIYIHQKYDYQRLLFLYQNNNFEYRVYNQVILKGTWSLEKQVLKLYDKHLKYNFELLLYKNNNIVALYFPDYFPIMIFNRIHSIWLSHIPKNLHGEKWF